MYLDRTPDVFLSEIILIDDASDLRHFGTKLENEERRQKERRLDMHSHFHLVEFIFGFFSASMALNITIMIGKAQNKKTRS